MTKISAFLTAAALVAAIPAQASEVILSCDDPKVLRAEVRLHGEERTFRSFYSAKGRMVTTELGEPYVDPTEFFARWTLLHCPTGRYLEATGFAPFDFNGVAARPVTADEVRRKDALVRITRELFDNPQGLTLDELPPLYEAEGLTVRLGSGLSSCACGMR